MLSAPEPLDQAASTFSIQDGEKSSIQLDAGCFLKLAARTGLDRACEGRRGWLLAVQTPYHRMSPPTQRLSDVIDKQRGMERSLIHRDRSSPSLRMGRSSNENGSRQILPRQRSDRHSLASFKRKDKLIQKGEQE
ncbi:unnamed protein product [Ilex paraguariensis]|uniref:Uncharacterized protein n=1 Tax=Ilex paraguariensis TaxID=185542 RepID=A0ABC8TYG9_9AQUA